MKLASYIFTFGFQLSFTLFLLLGIGPLLFEQAHNLKIESTTTKSLHSLSMRYAFQESGTSKYAQLTLVTHKRDSLEKLFYIPDNKHKRLLAILQKEAGVKKERIGTLLPLNLTKKQLQSFTNSTYSENNKTINYLTLNGQNVIGKAPR